MACPISIRRDNLRSPVIHNFSQGDQLLSHEIAHLPEFYRHSKADLSGIWEAPRLQSVPTDLRLRRSQLSPLDLSFLRPRPVPAPPKMAGMWEPVSDGTSVPLAIVVDDDVSRAFDTVYDEISEQYMGDFEPGCPSNLGLLLILAKRAFNDSRFEHHKERMAIMVEELSAFADAFLASQEVLDPSTVSNEAYEDNEMTAGDELLMLSLAVRLGKKVAIIPQQEQRPVFVTFLSFPRQISGEYVRLWFGFDHEVLSRKVRWQHLAELVSKDVWDLSFSHFPQ